MTFREWWKRQKSWVKGGLIGFFIGIALVIFTYTYPIFYGECWICLIFWFPILDLLNINFFKYGPYTSGLIIQTLLMVLQYILLGMILGSIFSLIKSIFKKRQ